MMGLERASTRSTIVRVEAPPKVVFVDVDDTLVRSFGSKRIPIGLSLIHI